MGETIIVGCTVKAAIISNLEQERASLEVNKGAGKIGCFLDTQ